MLIELKNERVRDTLWLEFGLTYNNGKLSGEGRNFHNIHTILEKRFHNTYYNILKAYQTSVSSRSELTAYVGDLTTTELDDLELNGFFINKYNVLFIHYITHDVYTELQCLKNNKHTKVNTYNVAVSLIEHWPRIPVARQCMKKSELKHLTNTPKFDYVDGSKTFHIKLPVPLNDLDNGKRSEFVLVDTIDVSSDTKFKYMIKVGNHPYIYTDAEPTPNSIVGIIKLDQTWYVRTKQFINKLMFIIKNIRRK